MKQIDRQKLKQMELIIDGLYTIHDSLSPYLQAKEEGGLPWMYLIMPLRAHIRDMLNETPKYKKQNLDKFGEKIRK